MGKCVLLPVAAGDHVALRITASFLPQSFESGDYLVHIGLRQASIRLDHDGYDIEDKYSATVSKEFWHEKSKEKIENQLGAQGEASGKGRLASFMAWAVKISAGIKRQDVRTLEGRTVLPLVEATPEGWSIGGSYGDPRAASEAGHAALTGCLRGDYLTGREGEARDAAQKKDAPTAVLRARVEGVNSNMLKATLYGAAGGLTVSFERKDGAATPHARVEAEEQAEKYKRALIDICLQKASKEARGAALPGEILLCEETRGVPKLAPRAPKLK